MTDRELIAEIVQKRQTQAFAVLMSRYTGLIYSKSLQILRRTDLAQDNTQQTFIRAYERLEEFRGEQLGSWLVPIATHLALRLLEKERRMMPSDTATMPLQQAQTSLQEVREREELLQMVAEAIDCLPPADREIMRRHYFDKQKTDDIARQMGLSQSNVLVRMHRIRERLKKQLTHETDN